MCEVLEQVMLLHALTGDHAAVAAAAAGMLPAERQELRQALTDVTVALGLDCAAYGGLVSLREAASVGPLGGPYQHYHPGHRPASGKIPASQAT